jgi:probable HAF family extracellular repeat protein
MSMTNYRSLDYIVVLLTSFWSFAAEAPAARYTVTDLGVAGAENTLGWGINSKGQVTGYASSTIPADDTVNGFVWNPAAPNSSTGALHSLGVLGGNFSWGIGINASGQISGVGTTADETSEHATLWMPATPNGTTGTTYDLGTLGGTSSQGTGINDSGQLTGYSDLPDDAQSHAILWNPTAVNSDSGEMHDLGTLGGTMSFGWDINSGGVVTGEADTNAQTHAFLWKPSTPNSTVGTMHDLGTLGGSWSSGSGINDSGQVAGSSSNEDEVSRAFLWTPANVGEIAGTMLDLGTLGGSESYGYAVNAAGQAVGSSYVTAEISNYSHAFLYTTESGMLDLNTMIDPLSSWELVDADDINDLGQITGQGLINDEYHAFLLTPILVPGDFNGDGDVDGNDFLIWQRGVGGVHDAATLAEWRAHFDASASAAARGVPEPGSLGLTAWSLWAVHVFRLRKP